MNSTPNKIRALTLFSGGLDSLLAVCILKSQGIEISGVVFQSVFFGAQKALTSARRLGIPLKVVNFNEIIIGLVKHPRHGFGAAMNPCIDCHIAMLAQAGKIMRAENFNFVATGEVLNERPMSQRPKALQIIAQESGLNGYLLRPLSAGLLDITEPEKNKWVDRGKLYAIAGRNRKPQMALARQFGLADFPQPAGGCLLTDPGYGKKLRDLQDHEGLDDIKKIALLRVGRHLRLGKLKLIVGRNQTDNEVLERAADNSAVVLKTIHVPGPTALLDANASEEEIQTAAAVCAGYSDGNANTKVAVAIHSGDETRIIEAPPADQGMLDSLRVQT